MQQELTMNQPRKTQPSCLLEENEDFLRVAFPPGTRLDIDLLMEAIKICAERIKQLGKNDLWDLQNCNIDRDLNFLTLREAVVYIMSKGYRRGRSGRTAILVSSDFIYGVARTFQSIAEVKDIGYDIEIFQDESEALVWLNGSADGEAA